MKKMLAALLILALSLCAFGCAPADEQESAADTDAAPSVSEAEDMAALKERNAFVASLFKGTIKVEERAGAYGDEEIGGGSFFPMRFSGERIEAYEQYNATAKIGAPYYNCTSGVRMDFYTDAHEISFDFTVRESFFDRSPDHPDDCFALFENGELKETYLVQYGTNGTLAYKCQDEGQKRITVVFPNWHGVILREINVGNATPYTEYEHSFLMLGASCDQGLFADNPSHSWIHAVSQSFNADYLNLSVGGEVFRKEALDEGLPFTPTHIFVDLGGNDFYSGLDEQTLAKNCSEYFARLREIYPDVPVTVVTSFRDNKPKSWNQTIITAAQEFEFNTIAGSSLVSQEADRWNVDLVHPNSKGFNEIAENMVPLLREIIG